MQFTPCCFFLFFAVLLLEQLAAARIVLIESVNHISPEQRQRVAHDEMRWKAN